MDHKRILEIFKRVLELAKADPNALAPNLGSTKSGKIIHYDVEHPSHEGWSADDHGEASQAFAAKAKLTADAALMSRDRMMGLEANKLLARARHHQDRKRHIEWQVEHAAKEKAKLEPKGFVHVHQHASAVRNNNPNPVQGHPKTLDDLTTLAGYHGRPQHEFSDKPDKKFGYSTYQVNPDKSLRFLHGDYDSSD